MIFYRTEGYININMYIFISIFMKRTGHFTPVDCTYLKKNYNVSSIIIKQRHLPTIGLLSTVRRIDVDPSL